MLAVQKFRRSLVALCVFFLPVPAVTQDVLEEIIVTADFRERAASKLPASVTVLDQETVDSAAIQHFEELIQLVPNLNWSGDGHRARYLQIRGVGELEQYEGAPNPSVGFLIDELSVPIEKAEANRDKHVVIGGRISGDKLFSRNKWLAHELGKR